MRKHKFIFINSIYGLILFSAAYIFFPYLILENLNLNHYIYNYYSTVGVLNICVPVAIILFCFYFVKIIGGDLEIAYDTGAIRSFGVFVGFIHFMLMFEMYWSLITNGLPSDRNAGWQLYQYYYGRPLPTVTTNLFIALALANFNKRGILIPLLFLLCVAVPDLLIGSRINVARFIFASVIIYGLKDRRVIGVLFIFIFVFFSRQVFGDYPLDFEIETLPYYFGEGINVMLGVSIASSVDVARLGCNPYEDFLRLIIPPVFRGYLDLGSDFTSCINQKIFGPLGLDGLAGSFITDYSVNFTAFLISLLVMLIIPYIAGRILKFKGVFLFVFLILWVTFIPMYFRWGLISGVTLLLSIAIYGLAPVYLLFIILSGIYEKNK